MEKLHNSSYIELLGLCASRFSGLIVWRAIPSRDGTLLDLQCLSLHS